MNNVFNPEMEKIKIQKTIDKTYNKLNHKYSRNSDKNAGKTPLQKGFAIGLSIFTALLVFICAVVCLSTLINTKNQTPNNILGRSALKVASGSMTANSITIDGVEYPSGFKIGDNISVYPVNPRTLKKGDKIAFYVYPANYLLYHNVSKEEITDTIPPDTEPQLQLELCHLFGFHTPEITEAAKNGGMLTFHHITNVYEDENHKIWFKTKGSANPDYDTWFVSQEMVLGIYDETAFGKSILNTINFLSSDAGFLLFLLIPVSFVVLILLLSIVKGIKLSYIELDIVEKRRKLTDEDCVKNNIGFRMDKKTKYIVLGYAEEEEKPRYVSLLWQFGTEPYDVQQYVTRRNISMPIKKLNDVIDTCQEKIKNGEKVEDVEIYYNTEKEKILAEEKVYENRLKSIQKILIKNKKEENN